MCVIEDNGEEVPVRKTVGQSGRYGRRQKREVVPQNPLPTLPVYYTRYKKEYTIRQAHTNIYMGFYRVVQFKTQTI